MKTNVSVAGLNITFKFQITTNPNIRELRC